MMIRRDKKLLLAAVRGYNQYLQDMEAKYPSNTRVAYICGYLRAVMDSMVASNFQYPDGSTADAGDIALTTNYNLDYEKLLKEMSE